jgi:hypothetical protein
MKPGVYICMMDHRNGDSWITLYEDCPKSIPVFLMGSTPESRRIRRYDLIRVVSEEEIQLAGNSDFFGPYWFVPVVNLFNRSGWIPFFFGESRKSHFLSCESEQQNG